MYIELSHYFLLLAISFAPSSFRLFSIPFCLKDFILFYYLIFTCSLFGILSGYVCSDFGFYNIFTNSNINTPLFYKISATWSNHEGSLLLWCWLLSFSGFLFLLLLKESNFLRVRQGLSKKFSRLSMKRANLIKAYSLSLFDWLLQKKCLSKERQQNISSYFNEWQKSLPFLFNGQTISSPDCFVQKWTLPFNKSTKKWIYQYENTTNQQKKQVVTVSTITYFIYNFILFFFTAFLVYTSNPFLKIPFPCNYSIAELNPVLQDPILAIHPPCIYAGYVASAICFSLTMSILFGVKIFFSQQDKKVKAEGASLKDLHFAEARSPLNQPKVIQLNYDGRSSERCKKENYIERQLTSFYKGAQQNSWKLIRIWTLMCWSFLTFGILLGSWWAYHELGWGGWWFWDPVENASLEPWLLTTASIHSITQQRLTSWTLILTSSAFLLSILGTFFVRSGLLASVHSFATDSTRGVSLLFFLIFTILIFLLFFSRYRKSILNKTAKDDKQISKIQPKVGRPIEQILFLQNFFFCIICAVVLCGTGAPLLFQWFSSRDVSTGAPFYNNTLIPLFTSIFVMLVYTHYTQLKPKEIWFKKINFYSLFLKSWARKFIQIIIITCTISNFFALYHFFGFSLLESTYGTLSFLLIWNLILLTKNSANLFDKIDLESKFQPSRLIARKVRFFQKSMKIAHSGIVLFITGILFSTSKKIQFTQLMDKGSEIRLGSNICCLRSIDQNYGPTFQSICGNILVYQKKGQNLDEKFFEALTKALLNQNGSIIKTSLFKPADLSYSTPFQSFDFRSNQRFEKFLNWLFRTNKLNTGFNDLENFNHLSMFPEKRFFFTNKSLTTTKVAIHTNLFTDFYSLIGTGSFETGWFTTIMKLPFIFCIWLGFLLGTIGGTNQIKRLLKPSKIDWF